MCANRGWTKCFSASQRKCMSENRRRTKCHSECILKTNFLPIICTDVWRRRRGQPPSSQELHSRCNQASTRRQQQTISQTVHEYGGSLSISRTTGSALCFPMNSGVALQAQARAAEWMAGGALELSVCDRRCQAALWRRPRAEICRMRRSFHQRG
jgi:hypothetical protein